MKIAKNEITKKAGSLQSCTVQDNPRWSISLGFNIIFRLTSNHQRNAKYSAFADNLKRGVELKDIKIY